MPSLTTADGATIAYAAEGSGPAILLHPGMSAPGATLMRVLAAPLVAAGHTVVTFDPRDTGGSTRYDGASIDLVAVLGGDFATVPYTFADMADDALAVLDALGIASATWVGYSMGGNVVAVAQSIAPDRVDGLVYFAAAPGFGNPPTPEDLALVLRDAPADREAAIAWCVDFLRFMLGRHFDESVDPANAEILVDDLGWWGVPVGHLAVGLVGTGELGAMTPDEQRTLVMFADEDRVAEGGRAFARTMPGATVVEIEGYGHWLPDSGPWDRAAAEIIRIATR